MWRRHLLAAGPVGACEPASAAIHRVPGRFAAGLLAAAEFGGGGRAVAIAIDPGETLIGLGDELGARQAAVAIGVGAAPLALATVRVVTTLRPLRLARPVLSW